MYWRFILDPPHSFAIEQGCIKSRYAQDFRDSPGCFGDGNTWRCPATGVVMLNPSFRRRDFGDDFKTLDNFKTATTAINFWEKVKRSQDSLAMFAALRPQGESKFFAPLTVTAGIITISALEAQSDTLEWAFESKFSLGIDEGFVIHYHGLTDEMLRKNNWMAIQWDDIQVHISHQGRVRVGRYADRGNLAALPEIQHEFDIADPGDLLGKHGRFVFLPMAGFGLMMYHLVGQNQQEAFSANATSYALKGSHLIPWGARFIGSHYRLFEQSLVRVALNPFHAHVKGFQTLTYPAAGTYTDGIFSPDYRPSLPPVEVAAGTLKAFGENFGAVTATLRNKDNTGAWAAGTDRQGRIQFALTTSDDRYTPFVYGWGCRWMPVFATRNTTPITITTSFNNVLQRLELNDDSEGNFDGIAKLKLQSAAAMAIAERGDATFQVEYSDNGTDWFVYNGGICKLPKSGLQHDGAGNWWWQGDVSLYGMEERFEELEGMCGTAFDTLTIAEAINLVLTTHGFAAIPEANLPGWMLIKKFPALPAGQNTQFRFAPRRGDKGKKVLRDILFFARAQYREFRLVYDWGNAQWAMVTRSRSDTGNWTFWAYSSEEDFPNRQACYESLDIETEPPECNQFTVAGLTSSDAPSAVLVESEPIRNEASLTDTSSTDYLGRVKTVRYLAKSVSTVEECNRMARIVAPRAAMNRNLKPKVALPRGRIDFSIAPDVQVIVKRPNATTLATTYIKKRSVIVEGENHGPIAGDANEQMILYLDETWENEFRAGG